MRRRRSSLGPCAAPPLGLRLAVLTAVALVVLPLGSTLQAIEHLGHHAEDAGFLHAEAAHPDAAPHIEVEEHLAGEGCVACAHGSTKVVAPDPATGGGARPMVARRDLPFEPTLWAPRSSSPARAPPA